MQKKNYDSTFCGSLPIHLINSIQAYGALLVVNKIDFTIIQVSENIETFTGCKPEDLLKTLISNHITANQVDELRKVVDSKIAPKIPLSLTFSKCDDAFNLLAIIHPKDSYIIFELERVHNAQEKTFVSIYQQVKFAMANINAATSTQEVCDTAILSLRNLSGFDHVMMYQFDEDWNGTVIAELKEDKPESYLGLRFPASDVPKQARDLYFKNPYRLIPTIDYAPVKLYPVINPATQSFIDLSDCNLRSVPAVHLEYLKNMHVNASMSTAIIVEDKLWGLISCHNRTPNHLSYEQCTQFELLASVVSSKLLSIKNKEKLQAHLNLQNAQSSLMKQVYASANFIKGLVDYDTTILHLLNCDGAAIAYGKQLKTVGLTPDVEAIKDLIFWLQNYDGSEAFAIENLSDKYEEAIEFASVASGIIVLPIHQGNGEFVIGFRPEVIQTVNWGGNPNEAITFEKDNVKYHPRNSFKLWQEVVKNTALPWSDVTLSIAESFRNFIIEYTLKKLYANV